MCPNHQVSTLCFSSVQPLHDVQDGVSNKERYDKQSIQSHGNMDDKRDS